MKESQQFDTEKCAQQLREWYATAAGLIFRQELQNKLNQLLPSLFGYHAVQLGSLAEDFDLLASSSISQKVYVSKTSNFKNIAASAMALPFPQDTVDLLVLPHTLDFAHDPHQVLREAHRVLISEGHIVLIGFNPLSSMGLNKLLLTRSKKAPWNGHYYSARRLKDWLSLLDFSVINIEHVGLRPPIQHNRFQERLKFMTKLEKFGFSRIGGVQIFVAKKRVLTLTPQLESWRPRRRIIPVNVTEPSARQTQYVERSSRKRKYLH